MLTVYTQLSTIKPFNAPPAPKETHTGAHCSQREREREPASSDRTDKSGHRLTARYLDQEGGKRQKIAIVKLAQQLVKPREKARAPQNGQSRQRGRKTERERERERERQKSFDVLHGKRSKLLEESGLV